MAPEVGGVTAGVRDPRRGSGDAVGPVYGDAGREGFRFFAGGAGGSPSISNLCMRLISSGGMGVEPPLNPGAGTPYPMYRRRRSCL